MDLRCFNGVFLTVKTKDLKLALLAEHVFRQRLTENLVQSHKHCNENPIYVFFFWELRGLSPNFPIYVSVISFL